MTDHPTSVSPDAQERMLGGRCLNLTWPFTRDELIGRGLTEQSADEIMRFAAKLAAKKSSRVSAGRADLLREPNHEP